VLDDRDPGGEERGVHRPRSIIRRIDVERIDADESDAGFNERLCQFTGEMRMRFEILIGPLVRIPAGVDEERFASERPEIDRQTIDRAVASLGCANNHTVEIGQRFEF
jgi:hypothetical protein